MTDETGFPNTADITTCTLEVGEATRRLLEDVAIQEGRPAASVLEDAIQLYLRSRSEGYRAHLELAHRFLDAPQGSDEWAMAGAELSAGLARERGRVRLEQGGAAVEVRARLRQRQARAGGS